MSSASGVSNPTLAIFKKELKGLVFSSNFLLVCGLCTTIMSYLFPISLSEFLKNSQQAIFGMQAPQQALNIHYAVFLRHLYFINLMLIFVVPALTMRLFAEERKMRTYDLLLTSPVTSIQIVAGKYMSALGAVFVIMFLAMLYPVSMSMFVTISWLPLFIAVFGIFLLGAVYAAMDLFCSSLTESAIVAYVMAVILNVSIWFIGVGGEISDSPNVRAVFEHISLNTHLAAMVEGTIRTNGLIFFASIIFLFAFLSERMVESSRWR